MSAKRRRPARQIECEDCKGRRLLKTILEGKPCSRCGHVQSPNSRKPWPSRDVRPAGARSQSPSIFDRLEVEGREERR